VHTICNMISCYIFSWRETGKMKFLQMVRIFLSFGWGRLPQSTSIFYFQNNFLVNYCSIWLNTKIAQTKSHSMSLKKKRECERWCLQTPLHERSLFPNSGWLLLKTICALHTPHMIFCVDISNAQSQEQTSSNHNGMIIILISCKKIVVSILKQSF